jgi:foldase protein PrsA
MNKVLFLAVLLSAAARPAAAQPSEVPPQLQQRGGAMWVVNGEPIFRGDVVERLFRLAGNDVISQMVDEILVRQEAARLKVKPDAAQVESRIKRMAAQFPDEKTFEQKLASTGSSIDMLRDQLNQQVLREQLVIAAKHLSVSEPELKQAFEANKEKLGTPPAFHLRHILVATPKEAGDFLLALRAGADFSKLAGQVSLDKTTKDKGGDLGWVTAGMLQPQYEQKVLALKPGEVADPIPTPQGLELVQLAEVRPPKPAAFKDVRKDVSEALLAQKIGKTWPDYVQELRGKAKIERVGR